MIHIRRLGFLILLSSLSVTACGLEISDDGGADAGVEGDDDDDGADAGVAGAGDDDDDGTASPIESADCSEIDLSRATEVTRNVEEDSAWEGLIYVSRSIDVRDATLTIEPGTTVVMGVDTDIEFGWNSSAAALIAEGTAERPIRFCGETTEAGFWDKLLFQRNVTSNSVLRHVLISDAGGSDTALELAAPVLLDNVTVQDSGSDGVWAVDFQEDSTALSVVGSSGAAAVLEGPGAATHFPLGGDLTNNGEPWVEVAFFDAEVNTTFHDLGVPYLQESSLDVEGGGALVFEAGVEYRVGADADIEVGWNSGEARILSNGTEEDPVVFRGKTEEAGFWHGIVIQRNVLSDSQLSHTQIWHAGGEDTPALSLAAPIGINNVTLDTNATGIWMGESGVSADSADLTITRTEGAPLTVEPDAMIHVIEGGSYTGNSDDRIEVVGGDYTQDGTVPNVGVPYFVRGSIDTETDSVLRLSAGTTFIMTADTSIEVGWNSSEATIIAEGTAAEPIVFRASDERAGHWEGLLVRRNALSASSLEYVEVHYAGGVAEGAALVLNTPISVTNSTFTNSGAWGILKQEDDPTDYEGANIFTNNASGSVTTF